MLLKVLLLGVILSSVFVLWEILVMVYRAGVGRHLAERSRAYEQQGREGGIRVLIIGDSTAVGTGVTSPRDSIAGRLGRDFPSADITNLARNGSRTRDVAEVLEGVTERDFDLVLIQTGGNDILRFTPRAELEKSLDRVLGAARDRGRHVVLLTAGNVGLAPFFPRPLGWVVSAETRAVRRLFIDIAAQHGVVYVDLYTRRSDDPFLRDPQHYYAADLLHLSGEGYGVWYEKIRAAQEKAGMHFHS